MWGLPVVRPVCPAPMHRASSTMTDLPAQVAFSVLSSARDKELCAPGYLEDHAACVHELKRLIFLAIGMLTGVTLEQSALSAGIALTSFGQIVSNAEACNSSAHNDCICCGILLKRWVGRPLQRQWACCLYKHDESLLATQDLPAACKSN